MSTTAMTEVVEPLCSTQEESKARLGMLIDLRASLGRHA